MKNLLIIGARGFGREVYDLACDCIQAGADMRIKGFLDDKSDALAGFSYYPPIISSVEAYIPEDDDVFICGLGEPYWRKIYTEKILEKGGEFTKLISPHAIVRRTANIGAGCIITANSNISMDVTVADHCAILSSALGHDVRVGRYSVLSGRVSLNGFVQVDEMAYICCGAIVAPHKKIGARAMVGIGSVVISNVKPDSKVFGNPARKMEF